MPSKCIPSRCASKPVMQEKEVGSSEKLEVFVRERKFLLQRHGDMDGDGRAIPGAGNDAQLPAQRAGSLAHIR